MDWMVVPRLPERTRWKTLLISAFMMPVVPEGESGKASALNNVRKREATTLVSTDSLPNMVATTPLSQSRSPFSTSWMRS